jgi:FixJ family two-component response regulator
VPRSQVGWASLTDDQLAVARLVSEGLTNAEIADEASRSRHTVDFHLRQVITPRRFHHATGQLDPRVDRELEVAAG